MHVIGRIVGAILFVMAFNAVAVGVLLQLGPALGAAWSLTLGAAFLGWYLRDHDGAAARRALVRIRAPAGSARWIAAAVASTLALAFGVGELLALFAPPIDLADRALLERIIAYQRTPGGWIALTLLIALVVPMVEEFAFRGHIQHTLERRWGPAPAIGVAALLFTACHLSPSHPSLLLIPLTLGLAMGAAVYLFQSIWIGVAIHGLWNGAMAVLESAGTSSLASGPTGGEAHLALAVVLTGAGLTGWAMVLRAGRTTIGALPHGRAPDGAPLELEIET